MEPSEQFVVVSVATGRADVVYGPFADEESATKCATSLTVDGVTATAIALTPAPSW